jgi:hypothetical protein
MAGDAIIAAPMFTVTHAITIDAPPERVWPWLVQMGSDRAGWYAYDSIDNGGRPSARRLVPELQHVAVGDVLPAVPGAEDAFVVAAVDPPRSLVLTAPGASWEHRLERIGSGRTRLVARGRVSLDWLAGAAAPPPPRPRLIERVYRVMAHLPPPLLRVVAGAGHHVMEARHLRGIKHRAERGNAWRTR